MNETIERYIRELIRRSTPRRTAWNLEKIREGKDVSWNYIDGCMLTALLAMTEITGDDQYAAFVEEVADSFVQEDGSIDTFRPEKHALDDYNEGRILFPMYIRTGNEKYRKAAEMLYRSLMNQPRTEEGNFWHKEIYPNQVWLDGTYMALPFLAMYENTFGKGEIRDIMEQLRTVRKKMRDPETGLYYHGYDASRKAFWADPETGLSPNFWLSRNQRQRHDRLRHAERFPARSAERDLPGAGKEDFRRNCPELPEGPGRHGRTGQHLPGGRPRAGRQPPAGRKLRLLHLGTGGIQ